MSDSAKPKVLLVEDVKMAQVLASSLLHTLGYITDVAESGQRALELYDKNSYDFILIDVGLPDMPGFVVAEKIRKKEKELNKVVVPIVALTANDSEEIKKACLQNGINRFLTKPLTREVLLELLKQLPSYD